MVRVTGGCHVIWIYDVTGVRWLLEAYPGVILVCESETGSGLARGAGREFAVVGSCN